MASIRISVSSPEVGGWMENSNSTGALTKGKMGKAEASTILLGLTVTERQQLPGQSTGHAR